MAAQLSCDDETTTAADGAPQDLAADLAPEASPPDSAPDVAPPDVTPPDVLSPDTGKPLFFRAGASSVDITPGKGVPLGGFGGPPRRIFTLVNMPAHLAAAVGFCYDPMPGDAASLFEPNKGKHDPLTARTLVLANDKTKAAFIKIDAIGVSRGLRDDLEKEAKNLGIPKENLIVLGTHSHSGAGAVSKQKIWELIALDCFHKGTYQKMLAGIIKSLKTAHANLTPAVIGFGSAQETRASENRMIKNGKVDTELGLIKVQDATTGKPIAALINFAVHGTCLGASNMLFSADLMGYAEGALEKQLGGGVAIFTNGAEGDVKPSSGGWTGAAKVGGYLAETAAKLWTSTKTKTWIEIAGAYGDVKFPKPTFNGCMPLFGTKTTICDLLPGVKIPLDLFMSHYLPFGALRLDDVVFATIPGEAITDVGLAVKAAGKKKGFRLTFVVGLANDFMGYVVNEKEYGLGEYESQATMFGKNTGKLVVAACDGKLSKVVPLSAPDAGVPDAGWTVKDGQVAADTGPAADAAAAD